MKTFKIGKDILNILAMSQSGSIVIDELKKKVSNRWQHDAVNKDRHLNDSYVVDLCSRI